MLEKRDPLEFVEAVGEWLPDQVVRDRSQHDEGVIALEAQPGTRRPRLRGLRRAAGLTRQELAARAQVDYALLVLLENGLVAGPDAPGEVVARLAACLHAEPDELFAAEEIELYMRRSQPRMVRKDVTWYYSVSYERIPGEPEPGAHPGRLRRVAFVAAFGFLLMCIASNLPETIYWTGVWVARHIDWYRLYTTGLAGAVLAWQALGTFAEWVLSVQARAWVGTPAGLRPAVGVLIAVWFVLALVGLNTLVEPRRVLRRFLPARPQPILGPTYSDMASQGSGG